MGVSNISYQAYHEKAAGMNKISNVEKNGKNALENAVVADFSELIQDRMEKEAPYSAMEENGIINYNGVTFICNNDTKELCLGNMRNPTNVLSIPLSKGGCLKVNRDNLGDLAKAIGMFSPEDINLIMRAIAQDTKIKEMQKEIDDVVNSIGE